MNLKNEVEVEHNSLRTENEKQAMRLSMMQLQLSKSKELSGMYIDGGACLVTLYIITSDRWSKLMKMTFGSVQNSRLRQMMTLSLSIGVLIVVRKNLIRVIKYSGYETRVTSVNELLKLFT